MTLLLPTQAEAHLSQVARQFTQWRQNRANPRGSRIPESLWAEAIALAEVLPPTHVARHLGLKPHALKQRRGDRGRAVVSLPPSPAAFVEVTADVAHAVGRPATAEVEVQRPDGTRLRITSQAAVPALASLLRTFLEAH